MIFSALAQKTRRHYPVCRPKRLIKDKSAYSTPHMQPQPCIASNFNKITQNIPLNVTKKPLINTFFTDVLIGSRGFGLKNLILSTKRAIRAVILHYAPPKQTFSHLFSAKQKQNIVHSLHFSVKSTRIQAYLGEWQSEYA